MGAVHLAIWFNRKANHYVSSPLKHGIRLGLHRNPEHLDIVITDWRND